MSDGFKPHCLWSRISTMHYRHHRDNVQQSAVLLWYCGIVVMHQLSSIRRGTSGATVEAGNLQVQTVKVCRALPTSRRIGCFPCGRNESEGVTPRLEAAICRSQGATPDRPTYQGFSSLVTRRSIARLQGNWKDRAVLSFHPPQGGGTPSTQRRNYRVSRVLEQVRAS